MCLRLPHSLFFHIPKTGGMWVRQACRNAGLECTNTQCRDCIQAGKESSNCCWHGTACSVNEPVKELFCFAFVRHPADMYRSFWCYKRKEENWLQNSHNDLIRNSDFDSYVRENINLAMNSVTFKYRRYGCLSVDDNSIINFVGHQERLADDLVEALGRAGEEFDEAALRATPKVNLAASDDEWKDQAVVTPELWNLLIEYEAVVIENFGYTKDFEAYQAGEYFAVPSATTQNIAAKASCTV